MATFVGHYQTFRLKSKQKFIFNNDKYLLHMTKWNQISHHHHYQQQQKQKKTRNNRKERTIFIVIIIIGKITMTITTHTHTHAYIQYDMVLVDI